MKKKIVIKKILEVRKKLWSYESSPILDGFDTPCSWCKFFSNTDGWDIWIIVGEKLDLFTNANNDDSVKKQVCNIIPEIAEERICNFCKKELMDHLTLI
jgi:hypothetical protein